MKKIGVLFICLFLFLILIQSSNIPAQDIGESLEEGKEKLQEGVDKVEDIKEKLEEGKWDYLGKEWKEIFLTSKIVSSIDSFLTKINIVFVVLFGESYSLSLTLFLVISLWFFFFFKFSEIFTDWTSFSSTTAMVIGLCFTIILAQFQILRKIVEFFGWLVFSQESNIWRFLIMLIIFLVMIGLYYLSSYFGDLHKKKEEEMEKSRAKIERGILHKFVEAIKEGLGISTKSEGETTRPAPVYRKSRRQVHAEQGRKSAKSRQMVHARQKQRKIRKQPNYGYGGSHQRIKRRGRSNYGR